MNNIPNGTMTTIVIKIPEIPLDQGRYILEEFDERLKARELRFDSTVTREADYLPWKPPVEASNALFEAARRAAIEKAEAKRQEEAMELEDRREKLGVIHRRVTLVAAQHGFEIGEPVYHLRDKKGDVDAVVYPQHGVGFFRGHWSILHVRRVKAGEDGRLRGVGEAVVFQDITDLLQIEEEA